MSFLFL